MFNRETLRTHKHPHILHNCPMHARIRNEPDTRRHTAPNDRRTTAASPLINPVSPVIPADMLPPGIPLADSVMTSPGRTPRPIEAAEAGSGNNPENDTCRPQHTTETRVANLTVTVFDDKIQITAEFHQSPDPNTSCRMNTETDSASAGSPLIHDLLEAVCVLFETGAG